MPIHRILLALLLAPLCNAQRVLHNPDRDAQAQAAVSAAKDVASASLFETQAKNLEVLARQQLETIVRWQQVKMRTQVNAFSNWASVQNSLDTVAAKLAPDIDTQAEQALAAARLSEVRQLAKDIRRQIDVLQVPDSARTDVVQEILSHLGDAKQLVDFAETTSLGNNPAKIQALNETVAALQQVQVLYASLKGILAGANAVKPHVAALRPDPLKTKLELLRVDEDQWKTVGAIRAREALEKGEIQALIDRAKLLLPRVSENQDDIEATLKALAQAGNRTQLELVMYVLHQAAAVAAQQETSAALADLRRSIEERRYSIQRSAVYAGEYEQTVRAAADRLALYWKSGLKPKEVADLLYNLSGAVSLPALALK
jgi:hypothetical protein